MRNASAGNFEETTNSRRRKPMKAMTSFLTMLVMAFALVSSGETGTATPYPCGIQSPAYTDYTDARAVPCDQDRGDQGAAGSKRAPDPMGSPGF
jgi:hypothetical protein